MTTVEVKPRADAHAGAGAESRAPSVQPPIPAPPAAAAGWMVPLVVLIVGSFMSVLDSSIVNVAIPDIQVELSGSPDSVAWIVTGYSLALGVVVPLSGWRACASARPASTCWPCSASPRAPRCAGWRGTSTR